MLSNNCLLDGDINPDEQLRLLNRAIKRRMKDVQYYMSSVNNISAERAKLAAAMKKRKEHDKPQKDGLRLFNTGSFVACRDPADIARELYSALTTVPPKWNYYHTEAKIAELVQAYENKAKTTADQVTRVAVLDEYFRAKKWHEHFTAAMHPTEGAPRSRLYQAFNDGIVRGKWKDLLEETIKRVKEEYSASWSEKLYPKGFQKPEPTKAKAAAATSPAPSTSSTTGGSQQKSKYRFKNLTEYRLSRSRSLTPAFARPNNLPADHNKWCADHCWCTHTTAECPKPFRSQQQDAAAFQQQAPQQQWGHQSSQQQQQQQQQQGYQQYY